MLRPDFLDGSRRAPQEIARLLVKTLTGICQLHRVLPTLKQRHAQFFLQILHLPAEGGLREMQSLRSSIEGALLRHGYKVTEVTEFHSRGLTHTLGMSQPKKTALAHFLNEG